MMKAEIISQPDPTNLESALIDEVMSALIHCGRISVSLGLHPVSTRIYQAEYELEKIMEEKRSTIIPIRQQN